MILLVNRIDQSFLFLLFTEAFHECVEDALIVSVVACYSRRRKIETGLQNSAMMYAVSAHSRWAVGRKI